MIASALMTTTRSLFIGLVHVQFIIASPFLDNFFYCCKMSMFHLKEPCFISKKESIEKNKRNNYKTKAANQLELNNLMTFCFSIPICINEQKMNNYGNL